MSDVTRLLEAARAGDHKAADALGLSRRTADRHWVFARAWLADALAGR